MDAAGLQRFTPHTITSRRALAEQLDALRRGDTAWLAAHEEYEPGLAAVAAAVRDHAGRVVAAVSVSGPSYRLDVGNETATATAVVRAAHEISARIGYAGS